MTSWSVVWRDKILLPKLLKMPKVTKAKHDRHALGVVQVEETDPDEIRCVGVHDAHSAIKVVLPD
jgi:hypothetical protein